MRHSPLFDPKPVPSHELLQRCIWFCFGQYRSAHSFSSSNFTCWGCLEYFTATSFASLAIQRGGECQSWGPQSLGDPSWCSCFQDP
ncbi:hypothetical protein XELAEV_18004867mg [Xenopus laevis]|uniref:Uncharacterized protein n=1 Tax=Xenopus laevis TaxID=8355 RepID=A0A974I2T4_XENLA|nr:hypothetical protein XELAEV_18004867mg [Xenopus laevis]